jgi:DNA-binding response OmpR family regulator
MKTPGRKIMIIEDDQSLLHSLSFTLKRHEYSVDMASDGLEALDCLISAQQSADPYCLLITEIQLPGLAGLELIDRLREHGILLPTLVITARADKNLIVKLEKRGIKEILIKPFNSAELATRISSVMEQQNGISGTCGLPK